jgi:hypothetical protein
VTIVNGTRARNRRTGDAEGGAANSVIPDVKDFR